MNGKSTLLKLSIVSKFPVNHIDNIQKLQIYFSTYNCRPPFHNILAIKTFSEKWSKFKNY